MRISGATAAPSAVWAGEGGADRDSGPPTASSSGASRRWCGRRHGVRSAVQPRGPRGPGGGTNVVGPHRAHPEARVPRAAASGRLRGGRGHAESRPTRRVGRHRGVRQVRRMPVGGGLRQRGGPRPPAQPFSRSSSPHRRLCPAPREGRGRRWGPSVDTGCGGPVGPGGLLSDTVVLPAPQGRLSESPVPGSCPSLPQPVGAPPGPRPRRGPARWGCR